MSREDMSTSNPVSRLKPVFGHNAFDGHEQISFFSDKDTGLKAIIGIHSTVLGPALGGVRMMDYINEWEALNDVLRLSRGMTYKSAITGLNLGGGKAVILGDANTEKTPELIAKFAENVNALGGTYITTEDVGTTPADMDVIRKITPYVSGISRDNGGSGNPAPISAFGVFMGMKAAVMFKFGSDSLEDKSIFVQGVGQVGEALVENLMNEGARVTITDINEERLQAVAKKYNVDIYSGDDIYSEEMDIYAPCALGATLNRLTIPRLKTKIVAGCANNQLEDEANHGRFLKERGILYTPDFLINAGGLINVYGELENDDRSEIMRKTEDIYNTTLKILDRANRKELSTNIAAIDFANERINAKRKELTKETLS
ncbi:MAG: Glu/Leu/Phe/Val dehydrogenase dimerization domain-containing protein [Bacteroidota bacterium]